MVMLLKPLALCLAVSLSVALHNGLARTPPMGWMTWERFRCTAGISGTGPSCAADPKNCLDEQLVKQHADILAQPEWKAAGYNYVNVSATRSHRRCRSSRRRRRRAAAAD